jgi:hypothetical protein
MEEVARTKEALEVLRDRIENLLVDIEIDSEIDPENERNSRQIFHAKNLWKRDEHVDIPCAQSMRMRDRTGKDHRILTGKNVSFRKRGHITEWEPRMHGGATFQRARARRKAANRRWTQHRLGAKPPECIHRYKNLMDSRRFWGPRDGVITPYEACSSKELWSVFSCFRCNENSMANCPGEGQIRNLF